jgi:hypothetical protein
VVVVGAARGLAELAAGSPVVDPRPLAVPLCAIAALLPSKTTVAISPVLKFIFSILSIHKTTGRYSSGSSDQRSSSLGNGTDRCERDLNEDKVQLKEDKVQVDTQVGAGIGFIEGVQALWNCGHRSLFVS